MITSSWCVLVLFAAEKLKRGLSTSLPSTCLGKLEMKRVHTAKLCNYQYTSNPIPGLSSGTSESVEHGGGLTYRYMRRNVTFHISMAGPGRSPSLVSFPDSIGTHVLLCVYDVHGAASDMAHSAACSSCESQCSPTRRPIAETPHQSLSFPFPKRPFGKKNVVYRSFLALVAIAAF